MRSQMPAGSLALMSLSAELRAVWQELSASGDLERRRDLRTRYLSLHDTWNAQYADYCRAYDGWMHGYASNGLLHASRDNAWTRACYAEC